MEALDKEWIFHGNIQQCEQFEKTPNTLGLKNMAGVFILVGAGIIGGKFECWFWIFNGYIQGCARYKHFCCLSWF